VDTMDRTCLLNKRDKEEKNWWIMGENQGPDTEKEQMYWEHQNKEPENLKIIGYGWR
jgi:hypothetical protein